MSNSSSEVVDVAWRTVDYDGRGTIPCHQMLALIDILEQNLYLPQYSLLDRSSRAVAQSFINENRMLEITKEDFIILLQDLCDLEVLLEISDRLNSPGYPQEAVQVGTATAAAGTPEIATQISPVAGGMYYPGFDGVYENTKECELPFADYPKFNNSGGIKDTNGPNDNIQHTLSPNKGRSPHINTFSPGYDINTIDNDTDHIILHHSPSNAIPLKSFQKLKQESESPGGNGGSRSSTIALPLHNNYLATSTTSISTSTSRIHSAASNSASARQFEDEIKYRDQLIESLESEHQQLLHTISEQNLRLKYLAKENQEAQSQVKYVEEQLEQTLSVKSSMNSMNSEYRDNVPFFRINEALADGLIPRDIDKDDHNDDQDDDDDNDGLDENQLYEYISNIENSFSQLDENLNSLKTQSAHELSYIQSLDYSQNSYNRKLKVLSKQLNFLVKEFSSVKAKLGDISQQETSEISDTSLTNYSESFGDNHYKRITLHLKQIENTTNSLNGKLKQSLSTKSIANLPDSVEDDIKIISLKAYDSSSDNSSTSILHPKLKSKSKKRPRKLRKHTQPPHHKSMSDFHVGASNNENPLTVKSKRSGQMLRKPKSQILLQKKSQSLLSLVPQGASNTAYSLESKKFTFGPRNSKQKDNLPVLQYPLSPQNSSQPAELSTPVKCKGNIHNSILESEDSFNVGSPQVDVLYSSKAIDIASPPYHPNINDSYDADVDEVTFNVYSLLIDNGDVHAGPDNTIKTNIRTNHVKSEDDKTVRKKISLRDELVDYFNTTNGSNYGDVDTQDDNHGNSDMSLPNVDDLSFIINTPKLAKPRAQSSSIDLGLGHEIGSNNELQTITKPATNHDDEGGEFLDLDSIKVQQLQDQSIALSLAISAFGSPVKANVSPEKITNKNNCVVITEPLPVSTSKDEALHASSSQNHNLLDLETSSTTKSKLENVPFLSTSSQKAELLNIKNTDGYRLMQNLEPSPEQSPDIANTEAEPKDVFTLIYEFIIFVVLLVSLIFLPDVVLPRSKPAFHSSSSPTSPSSPRMQSKSQLNLRLLREPAKIKAD